jgi:hypothetical protein
MSTDKFARGERVVCVGEMLAADGVHPLFRTGDTGTVIFREPLANYEVYHVELDEPRESLYRQMLITPKYLEAEK